jgi:hypothetical protein
MFYLNYVSSVLGSSVSKSAMSAKSAMSGSNLFYNITDVINTTISTLTSTTISTLTSTTISTLTSTTISTLTSTTISTLTSEDIQNDFSANQRNENKESAVDDKSIMFITGGIFLGLFIASLGLIIKVRRKKEIEKRDNVVNNPTYDIIKETSLNPVINYEINLDEFYEEPQLNYDLATDTNNYDNL